jgi:hypothetical protein
MGMAESDVDDAAWWENFEELIAQGEEAARQAEERRAAVYSARQIADMLETAVASEEHLTPEEANSVNDVRAVVQDLEAKLSALLDPPIHTRPTRDAEKQRRWLRLKYTMRPLSSWSQLVDPARDLSRFVVFPVLADLLEDLPEKVPSVPLLDLLQAVDLVGQERARQILSRSKIRHSVAMNDLDRASARRLAAELRRRIS